MSAHMIDSDSNIAVRATGVAPLYPHILFNKSPVQLRRIGARGGKAYGRNQRARRALMQTPPEVAAPLQTAVLQTTADAIAALDSRFPWLRCAEQRRGRTPSPRRLQVCSHHGANHERE